MIDVVYMGYSDIMMQYLIDSTFFHLLMVVGVEGRTNRRQYELIAKYDIPYVELTCSSDLSKVVLHLGNKIVIIMYKFEYIIPKEMVNNYTIINFHGGSLRYNRGAHATVRSILNMDQNTCLSMYQLTGDGIDEGQLIDEFPVTIEEDDDTVSLNQKLARGIPSLLFALEEYLQGEKTGELVLDGQYYPKVKESEYTIDLSIDTTKLICAKIRSQKAYQGAILIIKGKRYRVKSYELKLTKVCPVIRIVEDGKLIVGDGESYIECPILKE